MQNNKEKVQMSSARKTYSEPTQRKECEVYNTYLSLLINVYITAVSQ